MAPARFACQGGAIGCVSREHCVSRTSRFLGDELDEIRRFLPSTGQTISSLEQVDIFPVREFAQTDAALRRAKRAFPKARKQTLRSVICWSASKTTLASCPT